MRRYMNPNQGPSPAFQGPQAPRFHHPSQGPSPFPMPLQGGGLVQRGQIQRVTDEAFGSKVNVQTVLGVGSVIGLAAGATTVITATNKAEIPAGARLWLSVNGAPATVSPPVLSAADNGGDNLLNGGSAIPGQALDVANDKAIGLLVEQTIETGSTLTLTVINTDATNPVDVYVFATGISKRLSRDAAALAACAVR